MTNLPCFVVYTPLLFVYYFFSFHTILKISVIVITINTSHYTNRAIEHNFRYAELFSYLSLSFNRTINNNRNFSRNEFTLN